MLIIKKQYWVVSEQLAFEAWFKKGQFWVTKAGQIQPLSDNDLKNKDTKIQGNFSGSLKSLKAYLCSASSRRKQME
jgi:hypothetical protein